MKMDIVDAGGIGLMGKSRFPVEKTWLFVPEAINFQFDVIVR
jgi:hypothetical protein